MHTTTPALQKRTKSIKIHTKEDFDGMHKAGQVAAACLDMLVEYVLPGVTSQRLDHLAFEFVMDHGALPACLGYRGYRHTTCISTNHVICHGIPSSRTLKNGDITNIDVTIILDGWHGDTSRMYYVGEPRVKAQQLCDVTFDAMWRGIEAVKPGATLRDVARVIQTHAEAAGFSVVTDFCGHGIGRVFHDEPNVVHYADYRDHKGKVLHQSPATILKTGMFFTIEPMINIGKPDVKLLRDGWTVVTRDKSLTAQFEHSLGVTETGVAVFTQSPKNLHKPPFHIPSDKTS